MNPLTNHACARSGGVPPPDTSKSRRFAFTFTLLAALTFATACSPHEDHDDDDHDHAKHDHAHSEKHDHSDTIDKNHDDHSGHSHEESSNANVTYNEKTGLTFAPATAAAINLSTTTIAPRMLAHRVELFATIIDAVSPIRATSLVAPATADDMEAHPHSGMKLLSVNRTLTHATGQVEVTFELTTPKENPAIGDTLVIPLTGPAEQKLTIPNPAILRTATGTYAYRFHDGSYLRVPIQLGTTDGAHTHILSGLSAGDEVAANAVEQLWLTELRLTKGGGHSH